MSDVIARWRVRPAVVPPLRHFQYVTPHRQRSLRQHRQHFLTEQRRLWNAIKGAALAVEFYRAVSWDSLTLDFFSPEARLGVVVGEWGPGLHERSEDVLVATIAPEWIRTRLSETVERLQGIITARVGVIPWPAHIKAVTYDPATKVTTTIPYGSA